MDNRVHVGKKKNNTTLTILAIILLFFARESHEVPMETNQLEEALMMKSPVVMEAVQLHIPRHLILPKLREKILANKYGYTDVHELLKDLNM